MLEYYVGNSFFCSKKHKNAAMNLTYLLVNITYLYNLAVMNAHAVFSAKETIQGVIK